MKKIYLFLAIMLLSCTVTTAFGQATKEERVQVQAPSLHTEYGAVPALSRRAHPEVHVTK